MRWPSSSIRPEFSAIYAGHVLYQGRLARAVVAHQRQHLAARQSEVDAAQHFDRTEALTQALNDER